MTYQKPREEDTIDVILDYLRELWHQHPDMNLTELVMEIYTASVEEYREDNQVAHYPPLFKLDDTYVLKGIQRMLDRGNNQ